LARFGRAWRDDKAVDRPPDIDLLTQTPSLIEMMLKLELNQESSMHRGALRHMKIMTSVARNPFLVRYLVEFRRTDKPGRGVLLMLQRMAEIGASEPELREEGEEFILTLFHPRGR
jgi:hypothetical protein